MRLVLATVLTVTIPASWAFAITTNTVSFQRGDANGYSSISELMISDAGGANDGRDGTTVQSWSVDGYQPDDPSTTTTNEFSPDQPALTKWDNIFGAGATQIPQGATILSAQLTLQNDKWGRGRFQRSVEFGGGSMRRLHRPRVTQISRREIHSVFAVPGGKTTTPARPVAGYARVANVTSYTANIAPLVQKWANNPTTNNGYVLQSGFTGTADAWSIFSSGDAVQADRPKLSVTYTTSPVAVNTIQRGLNGYTGVSTAWVRSGTVQNADATHPDASVDDITYDGFSGTATVSPTNANQTPAALTSFQQFVDGPALNIDGTLSSPDDFALLKFNNVFGSATGQAPADKAVAKAWLVITTGDSSGNARSADKWDVYPMQRDWSATSLYSTGFGAAPGLSAADGDIPATSLDEQVGMTTGSEVWFDVTGYLESIRNGAADHGLAILHGQDTTDGWQMWFDGASDATLSPRLVVVSDLSNVVAGVPGDYNGNGVVDMADYVLWRDSAGQSTLANRGAGISGPVGSSRLRFLACSFWGDIGFRLCGRKQRRAGTGLVLIGAHCVGGNGWNLFSYSLMPKGKALGYGPQTNLETADREQLDRFYAGRIASSHCHHWHFGGVIAASDSGGTRSSATLAVPKQYEADLLSDVEFRTAERDTCRHPNGLKMGRIPVAV